MEMALKNGFCEMSVDEMENSNGGVGVVQAIGTLVIAVAIVIDLHNCYNKGYNEVISSTPPKSVSGNGIPRK